MVPAMLRPGPFTKALPASRRYVRIYLLQSWSGMLYGRAAASFSSGPVLVFIRDILGPRLKNHIRQRIKLAIGILLVVAAIVYLLVLKAS